MALTYAKHRHSQKLLVAVLNWSSSDFEWILILLLFSLLLFHHSLLLVETELGKLVAIEHVLPVLLTLIDATGARVRSFLDLEKPVAHGPLGIRLLLRVTRPLRGSTVLASASLRLSGLFRFVKVFSVLAQC